MLGSEFPEVAHRGPSLNWSGGGHILRGAPYVLCQPFVLCVCVCVLRMHTYASVYHVSKHSVDMCVEHG